MASHDSRSVAMILEEYVDSLLAESNFFSDLSSGRVNREDMRGVFGQYYLWRNQFHRWFGICVARSDAFGKSRNVSRILGELIECLGQEIRGDHHGLALSFLASLGIDDPSRIVALPVTDTYADSFLCCYFSDNRSGDEALAALAGRELSAPSRNRIILSALPQHYGVTSGLEFFGLHNAIEIAHFRCLWEAMNHDHEADTRRLIEAARLEIWEHITFWDDVYSVILEARSARSAPLRSAPDHA